MIRVFGSAQLVELGSYPVREDAQVAGVDPHRAQLRAGDLDTQPDRLGDVVGVDEQGGALAQGLHLGAEGVLLGVVQQRERVRAGAGGRHAVLLARPGGWSSR